MSKIDYNTIRLAWTDLETTGLETENGGIFEIACIVTDRFMNEYGRFHSLVFPGEKPIQNMNDYVKDMHTKNGLLKEILAIDTPSHEEADEKFSKFLSQHNRGDRTNIMLAGNSLAGVDIPFLKAFAPRSYEQLHYRSLDVTGFRIAAGIHFGNDTDFQKNKNHRAFDDILECIEEYRFVAGQVFKSKE